jgi:hypothetical protein
MAVNDPTTSVAETRYAESEEGFVGTKWLDS